MIPMYTTSVGLPKVCLAFDWPTQIKIPRTAPGNTVGKKTTAFNLLFATRIQQRVTAESSCLKLLVLQDIHTPAERGAVLVSELTQGSPEQSLQI